MSRKESLIACFDDTLNKSRIMREKPNISIYEPGFSSSKLKNLKRCKDTKVVLTPDTTFSAARRYGIEFGLKTAVLNFANPHNPGGGVVDGAMAQEECLCRSSNLYISLTESEALEKYYMRNREERSFLFSDRILYSRNVTVFKNDDDIPQTLSEDKQFKVDVITCAAPYVRKQIYINKAVLKDIFKNRIRNIFEVAVNNNVEAIILGAFGCGAFGNPPEVVIRLFVEVLSDEGYQYYFKNIVFAIKVDGDIFKNRNFCVFCDGISFKGSGLKQVFIDIEGWCDDARPLFLWSEDKYMVSPRGTLC